MTTASATRRAPMQERSRLTVTRILDAAAAIADEQGVDAATTRAVADRAGVSYPSLYRFFADREAILGELLERQCAELDARCVAAEKTWRITSVADLLNNEIDLHVAYYREHPSTARMWMGGRTSPAVTGYVRTRMQTLADRMHAILVEAGLIPAGTDPLALLVASRWPTAFWRCPTATATISTSGSWPSVGTRSSLSAVTSRRPFPGGPCRPRPR